MFKWDFISKIEQYIFLSIEDITIEQNDLIEVLVQFLDEIIAEGIDLSEAQFEAVLSYLKVSVLYHKTTNGELSLPGLRDEIHGILARTTESVDFNIPNQSLLAALYYTNDIIAGSSAMGRGSEESIIPQKEHSQALLQLISYLSSNDVIKQFVDDCRRGRKSQSYKMLVPLLIDIAETTYARLEGWHGQQISMKQHNVDTFYETAAESCMAKGSIYLLRELKSLPADFALDLCRFSIDTYVMENLIHASFSSRLDILETNNSRRYRSGNSGSTFLDIRQKVLLDDTFLPDVSIHSPCI